VEENRALVDLLAKGRSHVQELQTAATAFQPEDPTEAAMAHVSPRLLMLCQARHGPVLLATMLTGGHASPGHNQLQPPLPATLETAMKSCFQSDQDPHISNCSCKNFDPSHTISV
jgi:hypothetical protein